MVEPLFFILIAIAIVSYGIQIPLLVFFSRKMDGLIVTVYRNLSLAVTMFPVLFFVSIEEITQIVSHLPLLSAASVFGVIGFVFNLYASDYLPVGVTNSIRQAVYVIAAVLLGVLFLEEFLTPVQLFLLSGILCGGIALTLSRSNHLHLDGQYKWKGVSLACVGGAGYALAFLFFTQLSRQVSPLVAGYFWEVSIGILAALFLCFKVRNGSYTDQVVLPIKDILTITFVASTTISGTLAYGYAVLYGPYALASGLVTTTVLISVIAGWIMFKEKLSFVQISLILGILVLIFALRLVS